MYKMIMGHAMKLAAAGIVMGVGAGYELTRSMATMLFAVKPTDPVVFSAVAAFLGR